MPEPTRRSCRRAAATAIKQGVADGLDPAIAPLYTFGFADTLGHLTVVRSVRRAMFAANAGWYQALPKELQTAFDAAAERTQQESFAQIEKARAVSIAEFKKAGAHFYAINASEYKQWVEACGEPRKEWEEFKVKFAGSVANFEKLKAAANTKGPITVGEYTG